MAMSKGVAMANIVIGCGLLLLTLISIICGAVAMRKLTSTFAVSVGLWGIYFGIPGALSIIAGYKKLSNMLGVVLGTHILGIVLAIVGMGITAVFWAVLDSDCWTPDHYSYDYYDNVDIVTDRCFCRFKGDRSNFAASCKDLKTVRNATAAVTIIFAFCGIATVMGTIYGSLGVCCARREQRAILTTAVPAHAANAVVMMECSSTEQLQDNDVQQPLIYSMQPPPYSDPGVVVEGQLIDSKY